MAFFDRLMGRRLPPPTPAPLLPTPRPLTLEKPLLIATQNNRVEAVRSLLDAVQVDTFSREEALMFQRQIQPAMRWALEHEQTDIIQELLAHPTARQVRSHTGMAGLLKLAEHAPGPVVRTIIREMPQAPALGAGLGQAAREVPAMVAPSNIAPMHRPRGPRP